MLMRLSPAWHGGAVAIVNAHGPLQKAPAQAPEEVVLEQQWILHGIKNIAIRFPWEAGVHLNILVNVRDLLRNLIPIVFCHIIVKMAWTLVYCIFQFIGKLANIAH